MRYKNKYRTDYFTQFFINPQKSLSFLSMVTGSLTLNFVSSPNFEILKKEQNIQQKEKTFAVFLTK